MRVDVRKVREAISASHSVRLGNKGEEAVLMSIRMLGMVMAMMIMIVEMLAACRKCSVAPKEAVDVISPMPRMLS